MPKPFELRVKLRLFEEGLPVQGFFANALLSFVECLYRLEDIINYSLQWNERFGCFVFTSTPEMFLAPPANVVLQLPPEEIEHHPLRVGALRVAARELEHVPPEPIAGQIKRDRVTTTEDSTIVLLKENLYTFEW